MYEFNTVNKFHCLAMHPASSILNDIYINTLRQYNEFEIKPIWSKAWLLSFPDNFKLSFRSNY